MYYMRGMRWLHTKTNSIDCFLFLTHAPYPPFTPTPYIKEGCVAIVSCARIKTFMFVCAKKRARGGRRGGGGRYQIRFRRI